MVKMMYMKKLIIWILCIIPFYGLQAQVIEGTVYDSKTKETVPGVAIYLDGTSIITTSDKDGNFRLVVNQTINSDLIFSHLSYESLVIKPPFGRLEKVFFLIEKTNVLQEIRVIAGRDLFSRESMMRVFKEQFLGMSRAGKSCVITNEEDIVLNFDQSTKMLNGYSKQPLIIENKYMAYLITFELHSFSIQYTENTLSMEHATRISFKGTSSFVDQSPYNIMFRSRRDETYLRSKQYFFLNLAANTLEDAKFKIFNRLSRIEPSQYFTIVDVPPQKTVEIIPGTNISRSHHVVRERPIYGVIRILYNSRFDSEVVFLTNRFSVDAFGNPDTIDNLIFFGNMGEQRLGDMLPRDYIHTPASRISR